MEKTPRPEDGWQKIDDPEWTTTPVWIRRDGPNSPTIKIVNNGAGIWLIYSANAINDARRSLMVTGWREGDRHSGIYASWKIAKKQLEKFGEE